MLQHVSELPSFLRLSPIPLCACIAFFLPVYLSANVGVASTFWLLVVTLYEWLYKYLFEILFSVHWGTCPEVALLDHMAVQLFAF